MTEESSKPVDVQLAGIRLGMGDVDKRLQHLEEDYEDAPVPFWSVQKVLAVGLSIALSIAVAVTPVMFVHFRNIDRDKAVQEQCISSGGSFIVVGKQPTCLQFGVSTR